MDGDAPGFAEIMRHFSWDLPWLAGFALASVLYVRGYRAAGRAGHPHPAWRLAAFHAGLAVALLSVLSPLEHYGNEVLWINFLGFLTLTMIAAPLILLGSPLTLAFRASGPRGRPRLRAFYRSRPLAAVTFPVASGLGFAVVTYVWQFTALTNVASQHVLVRDLQQVTLLLVSLAFWLPALAADPLRWRMPYPLRGLYVLVEMTHKSLFGGMFLATSSPFHRDFAARAPAWAPSAMMDQRMAILILWIGGNLIFLAVLIGLVNGWLRYERRHQQRVDRRLALEREAERRRRAALDKVFEKTV
ncbi:MAG: cytochrome c oxidase assembly protein [Dehalococcoidia bacterium]|nr:cytochrome c oxidase assembly protein [Dehalococcoidia bacterium]